VWWTAILYIAAAAMFLRFYDLPLKPLHHDEGVNTFFLMNLVHPPHVFQYDPGNYHGPTLFYFAWLGAALTGLSTVGIRLVPAVAGLLAVMLLLPLRREIGAVGALAAAAWLALSPGAVYFSRYFIHEMLLVCFTVATVVAAVMWWRSGRSVYLYLAAASSGLMFATKETAIISAGVLIIATLTSVLFCDFQMVRRENERGQLWVRLAVATSERRRAAVMRLGQLGGFRLIVQAVGVFIAVSVLFYTSGLTNWQGAIDAVRTFAVWTRTGTTAHVHPWHTYIGWLAAEELPLLILGGIGAILAVWRSDNRFAVFASLWVLGVLAAYSLIPYKTPWLTLNVIAPLAICGGYAFEQMWHHRRVLPRGFAAIVAAAVAGTAAIQAVSLSFVQYDNPQYPYVYVHTSREVFDLVREIDRLAVLNPGVSIAVTSREQFPLSWYLRGYPAGYYGAPTVTNHRLVVASGDQQATLDAALGERYTRIGSYRLRAGVRLLLYASRDLRRPPVDVIDDRTR